MEFIKKTDLSLKNGGYLSNKDGVPVYNDQFVNAQHRAHYIVELAHATKGKDYVGKKADSFLTTVSEVVEGINATQTIKYAKEVKAPVRELQDKLAQEAMAWIKFDSASSTSKRINEAMQQFNIIKDFEDFGLFFSSDIVKLPVIYTIEEILEAVEIVEPHLESIKY
jgi:hypothetical protein